MIGDASILYESLPARTRLPEISHLKTGEWILVLKGSMTAYLSGRPIRARSGSIIAIPPGVPHRFVTGRSACQAVSIFSPALAIGPSADIVAAP